MEDQIAQRARDPLLGHRGRRRPGARHQRANRLACQEAVRERPEHRGEERGAQEDQRGLDQVRDGQHELVDHRQERLGHGPGAQDLQRQRQHQQQQEIVHGLGQDPVHRHVTGDGDVALQPPRLLQAAGEPARQAREPRGQEPPYEEGHERGNNPAQEQHATQRVHFPQHRPARSLAKVSSACHASISGYLPASFGRPLLDREGHPTNAKMVLSPPPPARQVIVSSFYCRC